jgi:uncharacterized protein (TIGR04255 family)
MGTKFGDAFDIDAFEEIPLARAPLDQVVCQVRIPPAIGIASRDSAAMLHAELRDAYPIIREEKSLSILVTPAGTEMKPTNEDVWRITDEGERWQIHLAEAAVALGTSAYVSRADFLERLGRVLHAFRGAWKVQHYDRVGIRYINRLVAPTEPNAPPLSGLIRRDLLGGLNVPLTHCAGLVHAVTESLFAIEQDKIRARWGLLPAGAVVDVSVKTMPTESWVLDLDVFRDTGATFDPDAVTKLVDQLARRAYALFRYVATDALLRHAGATLGGEES